MDAKTEKEEEEEKGIIRRTGCITLRAPLDPDYYPPLQDDIFTIDMTQTPIYLKVIRPDGDDLRIGPFDSHDKVSRVIDRIQEVTGIKHLSISRATSGGPMNPKEHLFHYGISVESNTVVLDRHSV